jgi:hypothetical protein
VAANPVFQDISTSKSVPLQQLAASTISAPPEDVLPAAFSLPCLPEPVSVQSLAFRLDGSCLRYANCIINRGHHDQAIHLMMEAGVVYHGSLQNENTQEHHGA